MCEQGEFDCKEQPIQIQHREKAVIKEQFGRRNISKLFWAN